MYIIRKLLLDKTSIVPCIIKHSEVKDLNLNLGKETVHLLSWEEVMIIPEAKSFHIHIKTIFRRFIVGL